MPKMNRNESVTKDKVAIMSKKFVAKFKLIGEVEVILHAL
jgi:hypothetical protein